MKKRILALILAICILTALLPSVALAATTARGTCGKNLTWTLDQKGVLTISGKGAMYNYDYWDSSKSPWQKYNKSIRSVKIKSGVTTIGKGAFSRCYLKNIEIPSTVTAIQEGAFYSCPQLISVSIPKGVVKIQECAFANCPKLESVSIPSSVTSLGDAVFVDCVGLKKVNIPSRVTSIGYMTFAGCANLQTVTLPAKVTSIGEWAFFGCSRLTNIILPQGCLSIGAYGFAGCRRLASVTLPSNMKTIGSNAFFRCSALKKVYFRGTKAQWKGIKIADGNTALVNASRRYNIASISAKAGTGGSASGSGAKTKGTKVTLKATPKSGYYFTNWTEGGKIVSTSPSYSFAVSKDRTLQANFAKLSSPGVKAQSSGYNSIKLSWKKVSGATGYEVYRAASKSGKYTKIGTIGKNATVTYTDKKLSTGTTYYYKARAYRLVDKTKLYSAYSSIVKAKPVPAAPGSVKAASTRKGTAKLSWQKVSGANGYEVYRATSKTGKYTRVASIAKGSVTSYTNQKLVAGKMYYYKIRAYRLVGKTKVYSPFSSIKSVRVKK